MGRGRKGNEKNVLTEGLGVEMGENMVHSGKRVLVCLAERGVAQNEKQAMANKRLDYLAEDFELGQ